MVDRRRFGWRVASGVLLAACAYPACAAEPVDVELVLAVGSARGRVGGAGWGGCALACGWAPRRRRAAAGGGAGGGAAVAPRVGRRRRRADDSGAARERAIRSLL